MTKRDEKTHGREDNRDPMTRESLCNSNLNLPGDSYLSLLGSRSFLGYLTAEGLGAFNDNFYRFLIVFIVIPQLQEMSAVTFGSILGGIFMLAYLLFSALGGELADKYRKKSVLVASKIAEIFIMGIALWALYLEHIILMSGILFLTATQSALNSPAKYGIIPEMVKTEAISRANGLLQLVTYTCIILGTAAAGYFLDKFGRDIWMLSGVLIGFSIIGLAGNLLIRHRQVCDLSRQIPLNLMKQTWEVCAKSFKIQKFRLVILAVSWFWFLGAVFQIVIPPLGIEVMAVSNTHVSWLLAILSIGIGLGSMGVGFFSRGRVELGFVPLGAVGLAVSVVLLGFVVPDYTGVLIVLFIAGFFAGFYVLPLNAFLQSESKDHEKGQVMAANNVINNIGIILAAITTGLIGTLNLSLVGVIEFFGILTFIVAFLVIKTMPQMFLRLLILILTRTIYRIKVLGAGNITPSGPAIYVANHVSFADALFIGAAIPHPVRFIMMDKYYQMPFIKWICTLMGAIPMHKGKRMLESIEAAREALKKGEQICMFPEGALTRNGNMVAFQKGVERIAQGLNVPIIPLYLDGVWGSIFSGRDGKYFFKRPRSIPYPLTIKFGKPMPGDTDAWVLRQKVTELAAEIALEWEPKDTLARRFIKSARRNAGKLALADSMGRAMSFRKLLIGTLILKSKLQPKIEGQEMVGLILPPSAGAIVANMAVSVSGKVPVNLNYTAGSSGMKKYIETCDLKTIITSQKMLERIELPNVQNLVLLEDILKDVSSKDKIKALIKSVFVPTFMLAPWRKGDDLATIIFTSGSTGDPKGVMLTEKNIQANLRSIKQVFPFTKNTVFMTVLPIFHSFGFTVGMWLPLLYGYSSVYHYNPLEGKTVGDLVEKYKATIMINTPAFFQRYTKQVDPHQFKTLEFCVSGAEKLTDTVFTLFQETFGKTILQGYGTTELSPVVSVNLPDQEFFGFKQIGHKYSTIGHPLPGIAVKVVDPETGVEKNPEEDGMLLVKGGNVMAGYYQHPEKTAEVIENGWYRTGDIAKIDRDGFITITGRLSRFSKIGGEMVPHGRIEEEIHKIIGTSDAVVTAVSDDKKGERLVVLLKKNDVNPLEIQEKLKKSGLPALWLPKPDCYLEVDEIPLLGTGKVDLAQARRLAEGAFS